MPITLNWTDTNDSEDGHRVYRSTSTIDPAALPTPLADLGAEVTTYTDGDVTEGETYYYRVSAYRGTSENVSEELIIEALPEADAYVASVGAYGVEPDNVLTRLGQVPPEAGVGDLLVAFVGFPGGATVSPPPGWTEYTRYGVYSALMVYYKLASSDDLGSWVSFSVDDGSYSAVQVVAVRSNGISLTLLEDAKLSDGSPTPPWQLPSLSLSRESTLVLAMTFVDSLDNDPAAVSCLPSFSTGWELLSPSSDSVFTPLSLASRKYPDPTVTAGTFELSDITYASIDYQSIVVSIGRAP